MLIIIDVNSHCIINLLLSSFAIQISEGDIFKGCPAADAIVRMIIKTCFAININAHALFLCDKVSPANSFGFMDGGIDMAYSVHFGWQM